MSPLLKRRSRKVGAPPGSPIYIGDRATKAAQITTIQYNESAYEVATPEVTRLKDLLKSDCVTWINVDGIDHPEILTAIGEQFDLHPLVIEDIANSDQRPKCEHFQSMIFTSMKMLYIEAGVEQPIVEQVSFVLMPHVIISFQEGGRDVFDPIRDRLRSSRGAIRAADAGFLLYALIDAIVDNYFLVMERLGDRLEVLEEQVVSPDGTVTLETMHQLRREVIFLRKNIWPLRELIASLTRDESPLISKDTRLHLRDVYDHVVQVMDIIETSRDIITGMMEIYISSISNQLNRVVTRLTVVTTIFVPLTFFVGVYGMNFEFMPELHWKWGYPLAWGFMLVAAIVMLWYFRRRRWV